MPNADAIVVRHTLSVSLHCGFDCLDDREHVCRSVHNIKIGSAALGVKYLSIILPVANGHGSRSIDIYTKCHGRSAPCLAPQSVL